MGTQRVGSGDSEGKRRFTARLLRDLDRLERMLGSGEIETGPARIGAELEMFLVDSRCHPSPRGPDVLASIDDPRVNPELGTFNLELNASPRTLDRGCLSALEAELVQGLETVRVAAAEVGCRIVLTGILPTLEARHARVDYMTPLPRYRALNEAMTARRGGTYAIFIKGVDELALEHDSVMLEACNTSFQFHLQVDPARLARLYNVGLLATVPVLAAATNSPLLFGRRLWRETRIALFQQSVDTRRPTSDHRLFAARVGFGSGWVERSVLEIYRDDVARFPTLVAADIDDEAAGEGPPSLDALRLFNSTVYRWLRPCYGVLAGRAHLRLENRVLPAGPTPADQVANAAFWLGLLYGLDHGLGDPRDLVPFEEVRGDFVAAARFGLDAPLGWLGGRPVPARDLILDGLLDVARDGLGRAGAEAAEADRYLDILRSRVESRRTGSEWMLRALSALSGGEGRPWGRLTRALWERQQENRPVHEWDVPGPPPISVPERVRREVGAHMQRDLVTVQESDPVSLAIHLLKWKRIRHLPVEDEDHRLVGIVTRSTLFRFLADADRPDAEDVPISSIMQTDLVTARAELSVGEAIRRMRARGVSSLPIVEDGRLVGLVTERDFMSLAAAALDLEPDRGRGGRMG